MTGSIVHQGQLLVHIAENGHSFELDCNENTLVESVMRSIQSVTGINFGDQLVLCLDMKLESQRPLSAYKLPSDEREVFIFNKARLQNNSPVPPPEQVDIPSHLEPPPPASSHDPHPLDDASDPALKALPSYERQFRYHYHRGHVIYTGTMMKYEHCERLLREQMVQERAVEVAILAAKCLRLNGEERPSMKEVAMELEGMRLTEKHPWINSFQNPEEAQLLQKGSSSLCVSGDSGSHQYTGYDSINDHVQIAFDDVR